jgi:hypothetical protein
MAAAGRAEEIKTMPNAETKVPLGPVTICPDAKVPCRTPWQKWKDKLSFKSRGCATPKESCAKPKTRCDYEECADVSHLLTKDSCPEPQAECKRGNSCLRKFVGWLCYRPSISWGQCCSKQEDCCTPELHTFFLHRCCCVAPDDCSGIPIGFSYTELLLHNGGCLPAPCHNCK